MIRSLLLTLLFYSSAFGATIYVETTGSNSNNGLTIGAPKLTLAGALSVVSAGDTIKLGTGTFSANADTSVTGTSSALITIRGDGPSLTILTQGELTIDLNYYVVRDIKFLGGSIFINQSIGSVVDSCSFYRNFNYAINLFGGSGCTIRNCLFQRWGGNAVVNVGGTDHLIEGNTYRLNNGADLNHANGAIRCTWRGNLIDGTQEPTNIVCTSTTTNTIGSGTKTFTLNTPDAGYPVDGWMKVYITGAEVNRYMRAWVVSYIGNDLTLSISDFYPAASGISSSTWTIQEVNEGNHVDIIQAWDYDTYECTFERNRVQNTNHQLGNFEPNPGKGLGVERDWTFRNNVFFKSRIQINDYAPGFKFYNNTVYYTPGTQGFDSKTSASKGSGYPVTVKNNLFVEVGDHETAGCWSGASTESADYNFVSQWGDGSAKTGLTQLHGINGGYTAAQIFVDPANGDLHLKAGSPAIGFGLDLRSEGVTNGFDGNSRTASNDLGAYIYAPTADTTAPTATAAIGASGTVLTLNLSEPCPAGATGTGGVTLTASGGAVTATYSAGNGTSIWIYNLSRTIVVGETVTWSYATANGIEDTSGNDLATVSAATVTNGSSQVPADITPPTATISILPNGTTLLLAMSESCSIGAGGNGGITITATGGSATATYNSGASTDSLAFTLSRVINLGESVTVSYLQPGDGIEDLAGNDLNPFGDRVCANNSTQGRLPDAPTNARLRFRRVFNFL